uniref:Uncharacterized protein AlNc14C637G12314 n=1 Tax=Albugo laibachii Nc14 TaxID=890382 RepID=F0X1K7_9STRA|nr:conserved hypothetical protein [Albugo laibachii Nc14]|eukprot:CCA27701.1 conserved hypothetical protein [Albugo laibachii Nc14]
MHAPLLIGVPSASHAIEQPKKKAKLLRALRKIHRKQTQSQDLAPANTCYLDISVKSWNLFTMLRDYLPLFTKITILDSSNDCITYLLKILASTVAISSLERVDHTEHLCTTTLHLHKAQLHASTPRAVVVLVTYAPSQYFPFCWSSVRRAIRFVHGVAALVTLNAYVSTLGGGHFMCKHINQARLMARLQIAISIGLQDPVLKSKCRIHLAYNAVQTGHFRKAFKIIRQEARVAEELENEELKKVCDAARTYSRKVYGLLYSKNEVFHTKSSIRNDSFYRQRIVAECSTYRID